MLIIECSQFIRELIDANVALIRKLFGKLFADKGCISKKLHEEFLRTFNIQLVTGIRSNMKNILMPLTDKFLLRKRAIIETLIDQLKNISQIEYSRHRSPINFLVNLICGLIANPNSR